MWLLSGFIDNIALLICQLALILGMLAYATSKLISWMPMMAPYKLALEISGIIILSTSLYFIGGYKNDQQWNEKFNDMEQRAVKAEKAAETANGQIKTVFVDRVKTVKETQIVIQEKIRDISLQIDEKCRVDQGAIDLLNEAALNTPVKK